MDRLSEPVVSVPEGVPSDGLAVSERDADPTEFETLFDIVDGRDGLVVELQLRLRLTDVSEGVPRERLEVSEVEAVPAECDRLGDTLSDQEGLAVGLML